MVILFYFITLHVKLLSMKRLLTFSFFFLAFLTCVAQSILVEYEQKVSEGNVVNYPDVWITDSITTNLGKAGNLKETSFVKKKKEGFLYCTEMAQRKAFYVKDSLHNFRWILTADTATILRHKCMSAKTFFRGRTYLAFYTPKIPISDGPWKFGGLPGLILEAKSTDGYVIWRAIKLDLAYKGSFKYIDVSTHTYIDWNTYIAQYKEQLDKFIHSLRSNKEALSAGTKLKYKIPAIEVFHPVQLEGIDIVGE